MKAVSALELRAGPGSRLRRSQLPIESAALLEQRSRVAPAVYIGRSSDLAGLAAERAVIDRGRKHPAKGLAALLLGQARIPVIEAPYRVPGQLARGARALLDGAVRRGERNIYLVAVDGELFQALWNDHASARPSPRASLLELLPQRRVPATLERRFVGSSPEAQLVRQLILIAAEHEEPVLVLGDTGTGKEVVARAVHDLSSRRAQAFVPVNCGAIPGELFESELFGHLQGAFTDAKRRKEGLWRTAHLGTLFLDEIGDLRPDHQVKILRAIEQGVIRPVGGEREIGVDARVIAATNRDLWGLVQEGAFREDLYYRLRAFVVRTPPLREHPEDVPALAAHFWRRILRSSDARLPKEVLDELRVHGWPGNARELRTVLASLHALFGPKRLARHHVRAVFEQSGQFARGAGADPEAEIALHRAECLRHLRRVDEWIRAMKLLAEPLARGKTVDTQTLARHRTELEQLCSRPLLFHQDETYSEVDGLFPFLAELEWLLDDASEAASYWSHEVSPRLEATQAMVFREVQRVLDAS